MKKPLALAMAVVGSLVLSANIADAAVVHVGPRSCSQQRERCVSYRFRYGPIGSADTCVRLYRLCMRSGVWEGNNAFPYGGSRITGLVRE